MNCKNLRIRSKKYIKYFYCKINKKKITLELCKDCEDKDYVKRTEIKGKKHKQTKDSLRKIKENLKYIYILNLYFKYLILFNFFF